MSSSYARSGSQKGTKKKYGEEDVLNFFYKPHTITAMIVGGIIMIYFAFSRDDAASTQDNVKTGLMAGAFIFLLFSMLQMRDSIFQRPHPAVWRIVMGAGVIYLFILVFLLFQSPQDARALVHLLDNRSGIALPERNYAEHCELYTPDDPTSPFRHLWDTINDEYIAAHFIGWWGKTVLIRDAGICWTISILFEVWELTFEFMLPNFKECWWDHIILDILVCNGLGIYCGLLTCRYLQMKEYDWAGLWKSPPQSRAKSSPPAESGDDVPMWRRALRQFTPASYDEFQWGILQSWKRFCAVCILILIFSVVELNAFFLKALLYIPPPRPLNIYRLLLWAAIGLPALREYYQFVTDPTNKKFGTMAWLCCAIVGVETLIELKYGRGQFPDPVPMSVIIPWSIFIVVFVVGTVVYFTTRESGPAASKKKVK
eukprot:Phypoly_transcript_08210.p1 GENE.Phypoly_transcript_08210~~Phypoly_transcript_08210.p1  ORF type:complete len:481 (+),score=76.53 Phypoly_transcript_08210:162-1445(+)